MILGCDSVTDATKDEIRQLGAVLKPALGYIETAMQNCFKSIVEISNTSIQSGTEFLTREEGIKVVGCIADMVNMRGVDPEDMMPEDIPSFMEELSKIQPLALNIGGHIANGQHLDINVIMEFIRLTARMMNFIQIMKEVEE